MDRRPKTEDITWFLDLHRRGQIDLTPTYQRRSVWTRKDRQFFLDTIFRDFPSPAVYLHKTLDEQGLPTYHVVDGKQRLESIFKFVENKLKLSSDFGDSLLDGKRWKDLRDEQELKHRFWNYQISVEMLSVIDAGVVNEVFDRLNRNSRKLTAQELRHARFDGWFINFVETEIEQPDWKDLKLATTARARRMADSQFLSELAVVLLDGRIAGFDQESLTEYYGKYDDLDDPESEFDADAFVREFNRSRQYICQMQDASEVVTKHCGKLVNFYSLWCSVALEHPSLSAGALSDRYGAFMDKVNELATQGENLAEFLKMDTQDKYEIAFNYLGSMRGASTDLSQRLLRHEALKDTLL